MTIGDFAQVVKNGCTELGGSITSWGRTEHRNKLIGGSPTSRHMSWYAVDVVYDAPLDKAVRQATWEAFGLHFWPEGDHDHISLPDDTGRF